MNDTRLKIIFWILIALAAIWSVVQSLALESCISNTQNEAHQSKRDLGSEAGIVSDPKPLDVSSVLLHESDMDESVLEYIKTHPSGELSVDDVLQNEASIEAGTVDEAVVASPSALPEELRE